MIKNNFKKLFIINNIFIILTLFYVLTSSNVCASKNRHSKIKQVRTIIELPTKTKNLIKNFKFDPPKADINE